MRWRGRAFFGLSCHDGNAGVFRNADKVFQSHTVGEGQDDQMSFKTSVPLELGRNVLTIIAREGDEDVTTRTPIVIVSSARPMECSS